MTEIKYRSDFTVDLIDFMGSDERVCQAARVSTKGSASLGTEESAGLINFLAKNRHGSPFEHCALTFLIEAPLFVWREHMRHRIGWSYNEESGRYKQLDPVFYVPGRDRPLQQVGKTGAYEFVEGTDAQYRAVKYYLAEGPRETYLDYENMLAEGVAKEVARMTLPLNIYSSAYATCNLRSLMHFLSLRTKDDAALFPSFPQWEINRVADQIEAHFAEQFPLVHSAFVKSGRIAP